MNPEAYLIGARCPNTIPLGDHGLWKIERLNLADYSPDFRDRVRFPSITILSRWTMATLNKNRGEVVMEDGWSELRRHLPIWMSARGRVLVTGLGLGCVVRGLQLNPAVEHVTVVERDPTIIRLIWPEFHHDERLLLLQGDALTYQWPPLMAWNIAWHDIWDEVDSETNLHAKLLKRYLPMCQRQGAWGLPSFFKRRYRRLAPWFFG